MTNEIHIYKAAAIGDHEAASVAIYITEPIHAFKWMEVAQATYSSEARELAEALYEALPGGTFDRLLVRLLELKASILSVSHKLPGEAPDASAT